jgi:GNAT superfamily N-acetyltransferase
MQRLFDHLANDMPAGVWTPGTIAYAWLAATRDRPAIRVIGWASLTEWRVGNEVRPQVQMYVAPDHRQRGIATALCICLSAESSQDKPLCVFSDEAVAIARRLGWWAAQYKKVEDGWIGVGVVEGRVIGSGDHAGRVHDAAPEVRDLPLASAAEGAAS